MSIFESTAALLGCLTVLVREVFGVILYFWTAFYAFKAVGVLAAIGALMMPGIATIIACFYGIDQIGLNNFLFATAYGQSVLAWLVANIALVLISPFLGD